jgi:hypothetical protein
VIEKMVIVIDYRDVTLVRDQFKPEPAPYIKDPTTERLLSEAKSWQRLQKERDAQVEAEVKKTKNEADEMAMRALTEDEQRKEAIRAEKRRREMEDQAREDIMRSSMEEREKRNQARREEIKRQEQLLSGRGIRAKTTDCREEIREGGAQGIQVLHYQDPAVKEIIRKTSKDEILKRSNSHGNMDKPSFFSTHFKDVSTGQVSQSRNDYKQALGQMEKKDSVFKKGAINRSGSSASSTTSR